MNNVIQNINIKDIVPNNNHHQYSNVEIEKLVSSIKKHGILEPITVRPKENKYELLVHVFLYMMGRCIYENI